MVVYLEDFIGVFAGYKHQVYLNTENGEIRWEEYLKEKDMFRCIPVPVPDRGDIAARFLDQLGPEYEREKEELLEIISGCNLLVISKETNKVYSDFLEKLDWTDSKNPDNIQMLEDFRDFEFEQFIAFGKQWCEENHINYLPKRNEEESHKRHIKLLKEIGLHDQVILSEKRYKERLQKSEEKSEDV